MGLRGVVFAQKGGVGKSSIACSAWIAADRSIVPLDCDSFSRWAHDQVLETVDEPREDLEQRSGRRRRAAVA